MLTLVACGSSQADPAHPLPPPPGDPHGNSAGALGQATDQLRQAHELALQGQGAEAVALARDAVEARTLAYGSFSSEMAWTLVWVTDLYIRAGYLEDARLAAIRARDVGQRTEMPEVVRIANKRLNKIVHLRKQ